MKKQSLLLLLLLFAACTVAHAQNGCINSPENPTALLALIGAGGALWTGIRSRTRRSLETKR